MKLPPAVSYPQLQLDFTTPSQVAKMQSSEVTFANAVTEDPPAGWYFVGWRMWAYTRDEGLTRPVQVQFIYGHEYP